MSIQKTAMAIHASGYIEKPVTAGKVRKETEDLRYPLPAENEPRLKIQCFGNFEVYDRTGKPAPFQQIEGERGNGIFGGSQRFFLLSEGTGSSFI